MFVLITENYFDFVTLESLAPEMHFATLTNQLDSTLSQFQVSYCRIKIRYMIILICTVYTSVYTENKTYFRLG